MNKSNLAALVAATVGILVLGGCSKQRAEIKINTATENIKKATEWQAGTFNESKSAFEAASKALKEAQGLRDGQQYSQALTVAADAVKQSQEALNQAKTRFADDQKTKARKAVEVARINDGQTENAKLFEEAQANLTKADEKYAKQKYEDSITLSQTTQNQVDQLLASLKNKAENKLQELTAKIKELEDAKGRDFMGNAVIKSNESQKAIEAKISNDRDYKQAIIMASTAINDTELAITETKKKRSKQELEGLESKISEAIAEEAPIFAPDQLKTCQDAFEELLRNFYENQFDTVLGAAEQLKPKVNQLITVTRIEATKDKINNVESGIRKLNDQTVEQYLPGRIKVMEDYLAQAKDLFANNEFDNAKEQASRGLIEQDRIVASFDALAEKAIQDAERAYNAAKSTYERMGQIFNAPGNKVTDPRLDARRVTESANLGSKLDSALVEFKLSNDNRSNKQFKKSIEEAKEAQSISDAVVNGTFGVVAQHALLEIQDQVSELERQRARDRAATQLTNVQKLVEDTQKLLAENQNREAAQMAAKTRAELENVKQELARISNKKRNEADFMIRRLEGGASATPAAGGRGPRVLGTNESPGGSDLNNKEMMFDSQELAAGLPARESVVVAQVSIGANPTAQGYEGNDKNLSNRRLPGGTYMTDGPAGSQPNPEPGAKTGMIIGTRPEPTIRTRDRAEGAGSNASYEGSGAPGPFVARPAAPQGGAQAMSVGGGATIPDAATQADQLRSEVASILSDDRRVRDVLAYEPASIERARQKLEDADKAIKTADYNAAITAAEDAQRIIVEAELRSAKVAATKNLKIAAKRINLAQSAGSIMFAPAQISEAINLFDQAKGFMQRGEYLEARDASEQAMIAAEDARLYNVNKARDLASLSLRYSGWKAAHPMLVEAENTAAGAEQLLNNPDTALQGQECAKQAVCLAQMALDKARDFTYQERIDNIYRALNQALRAGANYFNVTEVKALIAEISETRDEYFTRNYDAVELKLRDIEARLARVIETTPLVLEQNLVEVTEKLNALVEAGAEKYMAQEVDDVKSLMNRSVIDFRKKDFYSSYSNLKNAIKLTDTIEEKLQEQVYFDAVTELLSQLDKAMIQYATVIDYDPAFIKKLTSLPNGQQASINLAAKMNPNEFKDAVTDIYLRAIHLKPPPAQEGTHQEFLVTIKFARAAADNFQKLYIMDQLSRKDSYDIIDTAYNQIKRCKQMRSEIQIKLIDPMSRTKLIQAEKIVNY
ncbi:MAG: hypothetical protein K1X53_13980 [Candidatus Sumerlaeaceae bacterium]|nr:hypothetical protein [Candidatus Sumerlaeaceae bacterium]